MPINSKSMATYEKRPTNPAPPISAPRCKEVFPLILLEDQPGISRHMAILEWPGSLLSRSLLNAAPCLIRRLGPVAINPNELPGKVGQFPEIHSQYRRAQLHPHRGSIHILIRLPSVPTRLFAKLLRPEPSTRIACDPV